MGLVGGTDYRYYVEVDGDETVLDGRNMSEGANPQKWFDVANWRIEIQPIQPRQRDHFLIALAPSIGTPRLDPIHLLEARQGNIHGAVTAQSIVAFVDQRSTEEVAFVVPPGVATVYVAGFASDMPVALREGSDVSPYMTNQAGLLVVAVAPRKTKREIRISPLGRSTQ